MIRALYTGLILVSLALTSPAAEPELIDEARAEAIAWLALTDSGQYSSSWEEASALFRAAVSEDDWVQSLKAVRTPLGERESRTLASAEFATTLPGAPDGRYVVLRFDTSFEHKATALETVTTMQEADGTWRVAGYFIR